MVKIIKKGTGVLEEIHALIFHEAMTWLKSTKLHGFFLVKRVYLCIYVQLLIWVINVEEVLGFVL